MIMNRILLIALSLTMCVNASSQKTNNNDSVYTPYKLNYLPAGSPAWMAQLARPQNLDYNAMVDSFNRYLEKNPEARRKTPTTKQVVNHFRRFQKAYARFVQPDGRIKLPSGEEYRREVKEINNEIKRQRMTRAQGLHDTEQTVAPWSVVAPIETYDYIHKKMSPAQANIQRFKASASNPNVLYCGSETGMIFRTDDKGENWYPCNDGEWMGGEITTVDVSTTNPERVIAGAGGIYWISDDGGKNWRDITPTMYGYARTSVAQFMPGNDQIILAGDRSNLYLSTDGGNTWQWKLSGMVFDLKFSAQNPQVCYAAVEHEYSTVRLHKSVDGGVSWSVLDLGDEPLISARIGLSEAPTGADYVYLWACRRNHLSQPGPLYFSGPPLLYKSTDGGATFSVTDPVEQMEAVDKNGGQGYYDLVCTASATNPEHILVGILQLYRSTDGGATIENIGGYYGKFDLHCDMQYVQTNGAGDTWLSTDGGMIYSNDFFGEHAVAKLRGLYASEFWGFDMGWNEDVMVGGRNHNGNMSHMDRYNGASISMKGSERATGYVFLSNPKKIAFSDSENVLMPDDWTEEFVPFLDYWTYPKESSQHGMYFEFDPRYAKCFYIVQGSWDEEYKSLWRTTDDGASFSLVYNFDEPISAVAVSRSNPDKIVVGTRGHIYRSMDRGETFQEYMITEEMTMGYNYKIAVHPRNENEIWVNDGNPGGIWRTKDDGASWEKLDEGLTFANWEDKEETHIIGRFFLTGNEKNAAYAIAFTYGYLNETYTTPRGRVLYRDDYTDGWIDYSEGLPKVMNLNRMLPFYKEGLIRIATNNGIWQRELLDKDFMPIAQPLILNAGSGDNTAADYPRTINLDSYSIANQTNALWKWEISPEPLTIDSYEIRNPTITIAPDQTYDISLTVTTSVGSDTKKITGMIMGNNPVPEESEGETETSVSDMNGTRDLLLQPGNVVSTGDVLTFVPRNLSGIVEVNIFNSKGTVVLSNKSASTLKLNTAGLTPGVHFYMASDEQGYKKTGKLLIK